MEFFIYQHPKSVEDDHVLFPIVAWILDAMLRKVDPTNPVLVTYLKTLNPDVHVGFFYQMG